MNIAEIINAFRLEALKEGKIILQDDGIGPYIKHWDVSVPDIDWNDPDLEQKAAVIRKNRKAAEDRAAAYPEIGDQLDALLKHMNYLQMSGQMDLIKPLDAIVSEWLAVKRKYPKE